ncbi:hypothetical protein QUF76_07695 [Desulfobacterales bacterium HSG16]|nr:hypothetical protein [Desulfobacterales bacterium HSG16]
MESSYNSHVKRIIGGIVIAAVLGFLAKVVMTPESFGVYGHYRADAIIEEADREIRHWTNASCSSCHAHEANRHSKGNHKTISCEFCHGTYADHIADGKKVKTLPVMTGDEIKTLCLRCHNKAIEARPEDVIKTVAMPDHLKKQNVKETHTCNQCHYVHAPLEYINQAIKITGIKETI